MMSFPVPVLGSHTLSYSAGESWNIPRQLDMCMSSPECQEASSASSCRAVLVSMTVWDYFRQVAKSSFGQAGFLPELPSSLNDGKRSISVSPVLFHCWQFPAAGLCSTVVKECACIAWSELLQRPRAEDFSNQQ